MYQKIVRYLIDKLNIQGIYGQDLHGITDVTGITFAGQAIPLFDHILEAV